MKNKKLTLIALFALITSLSLSLSAQSWSTTLDLEDMSVADTFLQATGLPQVGGSPWLVTFELTDVDSNITVDIGGSNNLYSLNPRLYAFEQLPHDSLPLELDPANVLVITNGDTTYQKSVFGNYYYYPVPVIKVTKDALGTGELKVNFTYFRR